MLELKTALVIDKKEDTALSLVAALKPEFSFEELDFAGTILDAVAHFENASYSACFISEQFLVAELKAFFEDIRAINRDLSCVFAQVRKEIKPGLDRHMLRPVGIDFIISRDGTQHDKDGLEAAATKKFSSSEIKQRIVDMSSAMDILLREIDRRAEDKKRGRSAGEPGKFPMDFITSQTEFDEQVLARYYQTLTRKTYSATPSIADELSVPQKILDKELPRLKKSGYDGASSRVWQKLQRLHGVKRPAPGDTSKSDK